MILKKVYILAGPPGSGKSTWAKKNLKSGYEWVSRDNVRFSIISDGEDYFSHEEEVFDTFIAYINQVLEDPCVKTVFIDATHLSKRSRYNTLSRIRRKNIDELNCVCFTTPLNICLERNALRNGRERVPDSAVANMFKSCVRPTPDEGFDHVYAVDENGEIEEVILRNE